jgi:hypothetical protein
MSAVYIILVLYSELPMPLIEKYIYVASLQHHQIKKFTKQHLDNWNGNSNTIKCAWSNWKLKKEAVTTLAIEQVESAIFLQISKSRKKKYALVFGMKFTVFLKKLLHCVTDASRSS